MTVLAVYWKNLLSLLKTQMQDKTRKHPEGERFTTEQN